MTLSERYMKARENGDPILAKKFNFVTLVFCLIIEAVVITLCVLAN